MFHPFLTRRKPKKLPTVFKEYLVSELLTSGFVLSNAELNNPIIGSDATSIIQPLLDESNDDVSVTMYFDVTVSISDTLYIGSNTSLIAIGRNGVVLQNNVSKPTLRNRNLRPANNITIIDHDINILGDFLVNGNSYNQNRGTNGFGMAAGLAWHGVRNLFMDGIKIYNHRVYAQIATNVVNGTLINFESDFGNYADYNMDGVHWDGWCKNCVFENGIVRSNDDAFVCNADDGYSKWANFPINQGYLEDFYNESFNGPVSGLKMKNITVQNESTSHGYGLRILSSVQRVDNVYIEDVKGVATNYLVLIDSYAWYDNVLDFEGVGNIGRIICDNISGTIKNDTPNAIPSGIFSISCGIEEFNASNVTGIPPTGVPQLFKNAVDAKGRVIPYGLFKFNGTVN